MNPDEDQLSVIVPSSAGAASDTLGQQVQTGANTEPDSVAMAPDGTTAYVALRRTQQLIRITNLNAGSTQTAAVDATFGSSGGVTVGSEPTGVALAPHGSLAVVTNFGEQTVSVVDTATGAVQTVPVIGNPRAVTITNDIQDSFGNVFDNAQQAYVTIYFGVGDGNPQDEVTDQARSGVVLDIDLGAASADGQTPTIQNIFSLSPVADTGFAAPLADGGSLAAGCSPNQLHAVTINPVSGELYVPNTCASPAAPITSLTNVFSEIGVIDPTSGFEDTSGAGSSILGQLVQAQGSASSLLMGDVVALAFRPTGGIGYALSRADNAVQRIVYQASDIVLGVPNVGFSQIPLTGAATPIGIAVSHGTSVFRVYTTNWTSRNVSVVDISESPPAWVANISTSTLPTGAALQALNGKKFFYTGVGSDADPQFPTRWSNLGVSSCASCHPDGKSDDMTWVFAAGPRQTLPLDGTFDKADAGDQRALNWTANNDEIHDFENNTRGVQGGEGAIVTTAARPDGGSGEVRINLTVGIALDAGASWPDGGATFTRNDSLSGSAHEVNDLFPSTQAADWDDINIWVQGLRSNRAPTTLDPTKVSAGLGVFQSANCAVCHSGPKWTTSVVPYTPSQAENGGAAFALPDGGLSTPSGLRTEVFDGGIPSFNTDSFKVAAEALHFPDGGALKVGPERITCVIRNVGTYSFTEADGGANPVEVNAAGTAAQGALGFNPPSLLGLATSGPYLHDGEVSDLHNLFSLTYAKHLVAGNPVFFTDGWTSDCALPDGGIAGPGGGQTTLDCQSVDDLVQFLLSIDGSTTPIAPPAGGSLPADVCGTY